MKCACGRPTAGGAWCARCAHTVDVAIANVATYFDDLENVETRRARYGGMATKGSIGKVMPLVVDARFLPDGSGTRARLAARNTVTTWARVLIEETGGDGPAHDTVRSVCAYFDRQRTAIAAQPWAAEFKAEMLSAERMLAKVIDRPAEGWYAGECGSVSGAHDGTTCACACHNGLEAACDVPGGCGVEYASVTCQRVLYAVPDSPYVRCGDCGSTYPVAERREQLLAEAEDREATVEMIVRIVTTLGDRNVSTAKIAARIRQWSARGKIASHGTRVVDGRPRPLYRIGDVLDLLSAEDVRSIPHDRAGSC